MKSFIYILALLLIGACSGVKDTPLSSNFEKSNCNQQNRYIYSEGEIPIPIHELDLDTLLTNRFSLKSLNVAHAIGILDLLSDYVTLHHQQKENPTLAYRIGFVELSQQINQRINISSLEISAIASEMDCEEERADQISGYLKSKEDEAETKLTVGAIVVGAVGAIAAGVILASGDAGNSPELIGIGAGLTEATLGIMILLNKRKVVFYHPRNALREIWEGKETSEIFPAPVWYYLNYHNPLFPEQKSLRNQIIERWMNFGELAEANSKKKQKLIEIYFGDGGKYNAKILSNRANMLDQVEAHINLMKQDLKGLAMELENIL